MTLPESTKATIAMACGALDHLAWHQRWPTPQPATGEAPIRVHGCGFDKTDVNTRRGWYSKAVNEATAGGVAITLPRFHGADVCSETIAVGAAVVPARIAERVATAGRVHYLDDPADLNNTGDFEADRESCFEKTTLTPSPNALADQSGLSDAKHVTLADTVLVPPESGRVGKALVQGAKCWGVRVSALPSEATEIDTGESKPARRSIYLRDELRAEQAAFIAQSRTANIVAVP